MAGRSVKRNYGLIECRFWTDAVGTRLVTIEQGTTIVIIPKETWDKTRKALYAEDAALYHLRAERDGAR